IATADDVSGPRRGNADAIHPVERLVIRRRNKLCARLAARIRIATAERIALAIGPRPLAILVALVARDHDNGARRLAIAQRLEQIDRAHHIRCKGVDRGLVRWAYERLRREVKHDLRVTLMDRALDPGQVANVRVEPAKVVPQPQDLEEARSGR